MSSDDQATNVVMQHGHHYKDEKGNTWEEHPEYSNGPVKWMMRTGKGNLSKLNTFNADGTSNNSMVPDLVLDLGIPATTLVTGTPIDPEAIDVPEQSGVSDPDASLPPQPSPSATTVPLRGVPSFPHEQYNALLEQTIKNIRELGTLKGGEYAGDVDRLANFRRNAIKRNIPMELVWAIYIDKHLDAVNQYIDDIRQAKTRPRLEGLASRCDDIIVYMILFKCMLVEAGVK